MLLSVAAVVILCFRDSSIDCIVKTKCSIKFFLLFSFFFLLAFVIIFFFILLYKKNDYLSLR